MHEELHCCHLDKPCNGSLLKYFCDYATDYKYCVLNVVDLIIQILTSTSLVVHFILVGLLVIQSLTEVPFIQQQADHGD